MKVTKIQWKVMRPDHNCRCIVCNTGQAEFIADVGNWQLPVCSSCSYLDETELVKTIKGDKTEGGT